MSDSSIIIPPFFERLDLVVLLIFLLFCGWKFLEPALRVTHVELVGFGAILTAEHLN
jgi:hypothetical protein